jgi:hypothetical protein
MKKALMVILAIMFVSISVAAQLPSARVIKEEDKLRRRWWMSMSLDTVFDTNITHDERHVSAFGLVPSFGFHFRDNPEKPSFEADYEVALHRYSNTDEFDRVSQSLNVEYRKQLAKRLYAKTTGEISLKGSSEDREINNNYILEQQLQYRFTTNTRVAGLAAYRLKRYPLLDQDSNSIDSYAGAKIEQRFRGDRRVELGYRYDHNRARDPRNNYIRRTYTVEFQTPLSLRRRDSLSAEFRYAPRDYQNRLTRVNGIRVPRHDNRWVFELTYERSLKPNLLMALAYQYEKRDSNDPDKRFTSNVFGLRFTFDKWNLR